MHLVWGSAADAAAHSPAGLGSGLPLHVCTKLACCVSVVTVMLYSVGLLQRVCEGSAKAEQVLYVWQSAALQFRPADRIMCYMYALLLPRPNACSSARFPLSLSRFRRTS